MILCRFCIDPFWDKSSFVASIEDAKQTDTQQTQATAQRKGRNQPQVKVLLFLCHVWSDLIALQFLKIVRCVHLHVSTIRCSCFLNIQLYTMTLNAINLAFRSHLIGTIDMVRDVLSVKVWHIIKLHWQRRESRSSICQLWNIHIWFVSIQRKTIYGVLCLLAINDILNKDYFTYFETNVSALFIMTWLFQIKRCTKPPK